MNRESLQAKVESRRIEQLSAIGISDTCGNIMGIVIVSVVYWQHLNSVFIVLWASFSILSLLLRIYKIWHFQKAPEQSSPDAWRQYYFNNALLNGIAWCVMLIYATYQVPLELMPYIIMIIAGLTAAPSLNFYNFPNTHSYFAIPAIIPGAIAMIISSNLSLVILGLMASSWFVITRINADTLSREGEEYTGYEMTQLDLEHELEQLRQAHRMNEEELRIQTEILEQFTSPTRTI